MKVIADIPRGKDVLRIAVREFNGHRFADLRLWYTTPPEIELRPGSKGVKADAIRAVIDALRQAESLLRDGKG